MLAHKYRLPAAIKLSRARFIKTELFSMKYAENNLALSRFAFVVRKSVDKRAVARNRIRRVFRSCIEELLDQIIPGIDMLFFLEKGIMDKQQAEICKELQFLLQKRHLLA